MLIWMFLSLWSCLNQVETGPCFDEDAPFAIHFKDCIDKARRGNSIAQYNLGVMYDDGKDVVQDYERALYWYLKAAKLGDVLAQSRVGWFYFVGYRGSAAQNYDKAVYWYTKSANSGSIHGQYMLGWIYRSGTKEFKNSIVKAIHWYTRAAEQGDSLSQLNLGLLYSEGDEIPQNLLKAYLFLSIASENGETDAVSLRNSLIGDMSDTQLKQAKFLITKWKECPSRPISVCGIFKNSAGQ